MKKIYAGLIAVAALCATLAYAQVPGLFIVSPTGNEQINVIVPSAGVVTPAPQITSVKLTQIRDGSGYMAQTAPLTGFSIQMANNISMIAIKPAGTLATGTMIFQTTPIDGQRIQIFSSQVVTSFTLSPSAGQSVDLAVSALAANVAIEYYYQLSNTTWIRIQ